MIEPLRVIDQAEERLFLGRVGKQSQDRQADQEAIRGLALLERRTRPRGHYAAAAGGAPAGRASARTADASRRTPAPFPTRRPRPASRGSPTRGRPGNPATPSCRIRTRRARPAPRFRPPGPHPASGPAQRTRCADLATRLRDNCWTPSRRMAKDAPWAGPRRTSLGSPPHSRQRPRGIHPAGSTTGRELHRHSCRIPSQPRRAAPPGRVPPVAARPRLVPPPGSLQGWTRGGSCNTPGLPPGAGRRSARPWLLSQCRHRLSQCRHRCRSRSPGHEHPHY